MYQGKVDLHLHLDGSLSEPFMRDRLRKYGLPVPEDLHKAMAAPPVCHDLADYLKMFDLAGSVLQRADALEACAFDLVGRLAEQGLIYAEIRFAPALHLSSGLTQEEAVESVLRGLRRGEAAHPSIRTGLLLCFLLGDDVHHAGTLAAGLRYFGAGVAGMDLAGAEGLHPMESYIPLFAQVREAGMPFTIHAGECGSYENIRTAVELGARRIGHGVAAFRSADCMALLRERGTVMECCYSSNLQTRAVPAPERHPIRAFFESGIRVTVNTDNMTVSDTSLAREHRRLREQFSFTDADFLRMDENALRGAFLPEREREALVQRLRAGGEGHTVSG